MSEHPYLEMSGITKRFAGVTALDSVNFNCELGEIHALVGENGAGKSTLMNLLGGLLTPTEGTIRLDGKRVELPDPNTSYDHGIGFVHQESNLLTNLTVAENMFLSHEILRKGVLDRATMRQKVMEVNERLGYKLDPDAQVGSLKLADQQLTEIARAVLSEPKLLIMDEPTAALSEEEVERLFAILLKLRDQGVGIIYISHRLEEVVYLADRVTVFKDGKNAGELERGDISKDRMITMMVGRTLSDIYPDRSAVTPGEVLLDVKGLRVPGAAEDISFTVRAGEIVGLGGLEGQGQRETVRAIFGDLRYTAGEITVRGQSIAPKQTIGGRIRSGLGYVTHDRRGEGLILHESIRENTSLAALERVISKFHLIKGDEEQRQAQAQAGRLKIKTPSLEQKVGNLSGGNQQKVMLARWLMAGPKVLIVDEPTRGIDVGARMSVYEIIHELTQEGMGIVILTSDMLELIGLSDRILMFYEGHLTAEVPRAEATEERLMQAASGGKKEGSAT